MVRQIAEHNHYVQGVAWDPLNEYLATQSSDRSVHVYSLKTKDGQFTLNQHNKIMKMDLPGRRISSSSPAPPDPGMRSHVAADTTSLAPGSPAVSMPGTPTSLALPMNPPAISHSRRSSFGSSPSIRRSASPAPSMPLPAVLPMEKSPNPYLMGTMGGVKNAAIYANETYTSFFRRLTFAPDGSLLLTPAGQYKTSNPADGAKTADDVINTVYIYTRAGLNRPPIAHLPGHKKASIAVKCSPIFYNLRPTARTTVNITIDTSSSEEAIAPLPDAVLSSKQSTSNSAMDPPPPTTAPSPMDSTRPTSSPRPIEIDSGVGGPGPNPVFALPYRIVYAVATQDAVLVYDTQQMTPIVVVSNLHFATFTDLTWYSSLVALRSDQADQAPRSNDGLTLLMSSSDGFCSNLTFSPGELGQVYTGHVPTAAHPSPAISTASSAQPTPIPTPTAVSAPASFERQTTPILAPSASPAPFPPPSPTRSNSTSSIATQSSQMINNPTPTLGSVPSVAATNAAFSHLPWTTPPQTPMSGMASSRPSSVTGSVLGKRDTSESEKEEATTVPKKRRIAPTLVRNEDPPASAS